MSKTLSIESVPGHADFRALRDIPGIRVDLRYASRDNFEEGSASSHWIPEGTPGKTSASIQEALTPCE